MATPPYIEVTFDPPSASDTDSVFDTKASDTVGKLNPWGVEANDLADWIGTKADQALAAATAGDLPSLAGFGDQFIRVNTAETAVEFFDLGEAVDIAGLTFSEGDILYHDGTGLVNLGAGSEGQVLTQGASVPEWDDSAVKAWVNFDGTGTVTIRESFNVSSITDNGTGVYTINFETALTDANYAAVGNCGYGTFSEDEIILYFPTNGFTSSSLGVFCGLGDGFNVDADIVTVAVFR